METQENKSINPTGATPNDGDKRGRGFDYNNPRGRALAGLIIICVGGTFLAKAAGVEFPSWLFTWPMILIVVGLFSGAKHGFRHWGWMVPIIIGSAFLSQNILDISIAQFIWPTVIILVGLAMIFRPKRSHDHWQRWQDRRQARFMNYSNENTDESFFDSTSIFGGSKKVVIAKDFRGGDLTSIFGGSDINFTQADINGKAEIDVTTIFGGAKLIVPSNWRVQTEDLVCIFGGLDDKRNPNTQTPDPNKTLVIKGTCIFGGIDIRNF